MQAISINFIVPQGWHELSDKQRSYIVEGRAKSKSIILVNEILDKHEAEVMELWKKAQRGEVITKINR